jgi:hypothetical protein
MAYSEYKSLSFLKQKLQIQSTREQWLDTNTIANIEPSEWLKNDIKFGLSEPLNTEKSRSENLISPVLKELKRLNAQYITYFAGYSFNVDESLGLTGNCDYLFSAKPHLADVEFPIFCMVEAKNGVVEDGYAQCAAEMYAANLYNQQNNTPVSPIYGACTNGIEWVILKLENNHLFIHEERFLLNHLSLLLGVLQYIINQFKG